MTTAITGTTASEIVRSVQDLVMTGTLGPGDGLPSVRALAARLDINRNTVAAAYRQLVTSGVAQTRRRGGTVISSPKALPSDGYTAVSGSLVDLSSGNPDPALLPDLTRGLAELGVAPVLYGTPAVDAGLESWATQWLAQDIDVGTGRVVVTHGAVDGIERLLGAHLARGDAVAIEDPCFLASIRTLVVNGYRCVPVPVDEHGMTPAGLHAALRAGARAVLLTTRAHNPTGASLSQRRAAALAELLERHPEVLVIEDDHFSAISSQPCHRVAPPGTHRWAFIRSVSKFLGPDLRLALVMCDPTTAARLESRLNSGSSWVSHLLQRLVLHLLTDPTTAALLEQARTAYTERRGLLDAALRAHGLLTASPASDGLNVWIPLRGHSQPLVTALHAAGWLVRPGELFSATDTPHHAIRVTCSTITSAQATDFAAALTALTETHTEPTPTPRSG